MKGEIRFVKVFFISFTALSLGILVHTNIQSSTIASIQEQQHIPDKDTTKVSINESIYTATNTYSA